MKKFVVLNLWGFGGQMNPHKYADIISAADCESAFKIATGCDGTVKETFIQDRCWSVTNGATDKTETVIVVVQID